MAAHNKRAFIHTFVENISLNLTSSFSTRPSTRLRFEGFVIPFRFYKLLRGLFALCLNGVFSRFFTPDLIKQIGKNLRVFRCFCSSNNWVKVVEEHRSSESRESRFRNEFSWTFFEWNKTSQVNKSYLWIMDRTSLWCLITQAGEVNGAQKVIDDYK